LAPDVPPGTSVTCDDAPLTPAMLGSDLPVDPGKHVVSVSATRRHMRRYEVNANEGSKSVITVSPGRIVDDPKDKKHNGLGHKDATTAPPGGETSPGRYKHNLVGVWAQFA